jgi:hypothetical protein
MTIGKKSMSKGGDWKKVKKKMMTMPNSCWAKNQI